MGVVLDRFCVKAHDLEKFYEKKDKAMCDPVTAILIGASVGATAGTLKNANDAQKASAKAQKKIAAEQTQAAKDKARTTSQQTIVDRQESYESRRRSGSGAEAGRGITGMTASRSFFAQA